MASSISAGTTSATALVHTADTSGALELKTNNGTTALTLDTSQNATFAGYANLPNTFGFKNRIINGAMVIDQRNAGAATANTINGYTVDRWNVSQSTTGKLIAQQNAASVTPPSGFSNYLGLTSQSAYSVAAGDFYRLYQPIEGYNMTDFAWGTASASAVNLSFWVRSSLTGTFGGCLQNSASNRSYPFTYTISAANTWEQKTITVAGDTSGTWLGATNVGMYVFWGLGIGSTFSGTAGSWAAANYMSATGATSVVGTNGATFYITGVQLEKGSTATSFDYRSYGTELTLCQRYCQYAGSGANGSFDGTTTTTIQIMEKCVVPMRAAPSGSIISGVTAAFRSTGSDFTTASPTLANFTANPSNYGGTSFWTQVNSFTGGLANAVVTGRNNQTANGGNFILLTAEL